MLNLSSHLNYWFKDQATLINDLRLSETPRHVCTACTTSELLGISPKRTREVLYNTSLKELRKKLKMVAELRKIEIWNSSNQGQYNERSLYCPWSNQWITKWTWTDLTIDLKRGNSLIPLFAGTLASENFLVRYHNQGVQLLFLISLILISHLSFYLAHLG